MNNSKIVSMLMAIVFCFIIFYSINLNYIIVLPILLFIGIYAVFYIAGPNSDGARVNMSSILNKMNPMALLKR
jgi:hypothetical protein